MSKQEMGRTYHYIAGLDTSGFSYNLLRLGNEAQRQAEEGVLWLQRRHILDELLEKANHLSPEAFYREYGESAPKSAAWWKIKRKWPTGKQQQRYKPGSKIFSLPPWVE